MPFTKTTENDEFQWNDETGEKYHFPFRYLRFLTPGTKIIYYKGRLKDKRVEKVRLSSFPHYFGADEIGVVSQDTESIKNDYYAEIKNFMKFPKAVEFKINGLPVEIMPTNKEVNYWRNGVRGIDEITFNKLLSYTGIDLPDLASTYNDNDLFNKDTVSEFDEGGLKRKFVPYYERNQALRQQAINFHGYSCKACDINFEDFYGEWGQGFIHVHHVIPISNFEKKYKVNAKTDLIVLCANCHSMIHRRKDKIVSLAELKEMTGKTKK